LPAKTDKNPKRIASGLKEYQRIQQFLVGWRREFSKFKQTEHDEGAVFKILPRNERRMPRPSGEWANEAKGGLVWHGSTPKLQKLTAKLRKEKPETILYRLF
jgi:hypothetical protein